ncbi:MAG: oligosaccharide flippase family protein [Desulfuromonadales bacterium]|nr:oligosaccharide flippase family protein [Desulfuromonadales bacterium]
MGACIFNKTVNRLINAKFYRNVLKISQGTIIGQLIAAIAAPVILRLYTPEEYAVLGIYMSLLGITAVPAMLRYESAIPICPDDIKAVNVFFLAQIIAFVISIFCVVLLLVGKGVASIYLHIHKLLPYIWIIPLGMFLSANYLLLVNWSIRQENYQAIAKTKITQSIGMVLFQIALGLAKIGPIGLLLGHVIGQSGGISTLVKPCMKFFRSSVSTVNVKSLTNVLNEYRRFPLFSMPASLLEAIGSNVPILFFASIYSSEVVGWITFVQRIICIPIYMLAGSIAQVYFGELAKARYAEPEMLEVILLRRIKHLAFIGLLFVVVATALGSYFIPIIFGKNWNNASTCLIIMSPMILSAFISSPFGSTLDILQRQDLHLIRDIIRFSIVVISLLLISYFNLQWLQGLIVWSITGTVCSGVYLLMSFIAVRNFRYFNKMTINS